MTGSRTPLDQAADLARVETIARQRPAALAWSLGLMAWAVFVLWQQAPASQLLTWWGANAVFALWRYTTWRRPKSSRETACPLATCRERAITYQLWGTKLA